MSPDQLIQHTASYQYAESILTQGGYRITAVRVDFAGGSIPMERLLAHYENDASAMRLFQQSGVDRAFKSHNPLFETYGVLESSRPATMPGGSPNPARTVEMPTNFNIYLSVEPIP